MDIIKMGTTTSSKTVDISNNVLATSAPIIHHQTFGKTSTNFVYVKVHVNDNSIPEFGANRADAIGQLLKFEIFKDYLPFDLTVGLTSVQPKKGIGLYANPKSAWFNSLLVISKVDVPWDDRPFGYTSKMEIYKNDILLLCKGIWNFIGAYIYGTPLKECLEYTPLTGDEEIAIIARSARGSEHTYTDLEISNIIFVSGYNQKEPLCANDTLTPLWQHILGLSHKSKKYKQPFYPLRMKLRVLIRYERNYNVDQQRHVYTTYLNIASVRMSGVDETNIAFYDEFLDLQVRALKATSINV